MGVIIIFVVSDLKFCIGQGVNDQPSPPLPLCGNKGCSVV